MVQNSYGKESFNLRLTILRMFRKAPALVAWVLLGTLLLGGGYYVKNVLLRGDTTYETTSVFHVEYAVESEAEIGAVYINETSWNTYVHSDVFLDAVADKVPGSEKMVLSTMLRAYLASDLRVPSVKVTGTDPAYCVQVAQAVEETMVEDVPEDLREIEAISVADTAEEASVVVPDVRVGRAFVLGAVLSAFFVVALFLLKETWQNAIWLPASIQNRYGIKCVGTLESKELNENIEYFFKEKKKVAVCPFSDAIDPTKVLEALKDKCTQHGNQEMCADWYPVPAPIICPEVCKELRGAEGVLLVMEAGSYAGAKLEPVLAFLAQQDCAVTAVLLVNADEALIRAYYMLGK